MPTMPAACGVRWRAVASSSNAAATLASADTSTSFRTDKFAVCSWLASQHVRDDDRERRKADDNRQQANHHRDYEVRVAQDVTDHCSGWSGSRCAHAKSASARAWRMASRSPAALAILILSWRNSSRSASRSSSTFVHASARAKISSRNRSRSIQCFRRSRQHGCAHIGLRRSKMRTMIALVILLMLGSPALAQREGGAFFGPFATGNSSGGNFGPTGCVPGYITNNPRCNQAPAPQKVRRKVRTSR